MVAVRNVSPDALDIVAPTFRRRVEPGEVIEVPDEVANGRPGVPAVGFDGEPLADPSTGDPILVGARNGLLAQTGKWATVKTKPVKGKTTTEAPGPDTKEN